MVMAGRKKGIHRFLVPQSNAAEGGMIRDVDIYGVSSLKDALEFLQGKCVLKKTCICEEEYAGREKPALDFSDISGQDRTT